MKGYHSNSKLIFAYQDRAFRAAAQNNALDPNDTSNSVIRVVEPKDGSNSVTTHHNYNSDGVSLEQYGSDFLVSATISAILAQGSTGTTIQVGGGIERFKSVTTITTPIGNRVIDILLSQDVLDLINEEDFLYKAVIELAFSSGDSEDLILNLKRVSFCSLEIDPDDITGDGKFGCTSTITTDGSAEVAAQYPELTGSRVAYSISKAYRRLNEKKNATITPHQLGGNSQTRGLYGIGFTGYTPFSQPFGFVANQLADADPNNPIGFTPTSPPVPWLDQGENGQVFAYATTTTTHLTWFTGRADMTCTRLVKQTAEYGGTDHAIPHSPLEQAGINIAPFFTTGVNADRVNSTDTLGNILHAESVQKGQGYAQLHWGRSFGWFSSLVKGNIVNQNGTTVIAENAQNYGVPPIFRENQHAPNSGNPIIDRPKDFWGAYQAVPGPFNGTQVDDYIGVGNGSNSINMVTATSIRYSKLFWGPGDTIPGTNVPSTAIADATTSTPAAGSYLSQMNYLSTRNSFAYLPNLNIPLNNADHHLRRFGSVSDIITTPNANFFYPGCAGSYSDPYVPVFKGIARVMTTTRLGVTGTNTSGIAGLSLAILYGDNHNLNFLDAYGVSLGQSGYTDGEEGQVAQNYFSKVDLDHSVFFMGHTYPRHATGELSDQVSAHLPNFTSYSGYNQLWIAGWNMLKSQGDSVPGNTTTAFACTAQDVVFLVSGYTPTPTGQYNPVGEDDRARAITRNHPMSGLGFNQETNIITAPRVHFSESSDVPQANKPFTATSIPFHADLAENNANAVPPYPYSPNYHEVFSREHFPGFTGPTDPTSSTGYFNPVISTGGTDFNTSSSIDAIILPVSTDTLGYVASGSGNCFAIKSATVTIEDTAGVGLTNVTAHKLVYRLTYINICSPFDTEFQTSLSEKEVTVEDYPDLADRVSKVLEIFPFIEYRPLAMLNTYDGNGLDYTIQVDTVDDVDDIYIYKISGTANEYVLTLVIDNENSDSEESNLALDTTISIVPSTDISYFTPWQKRYLSVAGEEDFKTHKASYITVASSSDWATFTQGNTNAQGSSTDPDRFAYHAPFFTPGLLDDETTVDPPGDDVPGCTDPTASNYNPNATVDDGSCSECNSYIESQFAWSVANDGINNGTTGMRVGVYNPNNLPGGYLYGLAGGNTAITQFLDLSGQGNNLGSVYNSTGANYGGAVVANNDFVDNNPFVNLSIRGVNQGNNSFQQILEWMSLQFGETHEAWELKIRAMSDPLEQLNFEQSYSPNNPYNIGIYTSLPVAYSAVATGGSITEPTWDNISLATQPPLTWLETGRAFLLELHLSPKNMPAECTLLTDTNNVVLGIMWVTLCSCADVTNEYFGVAMNGISPYPWQSSNPFPILPYSPTSNCPDTIDPNNAYGDGAYPNSICFTPDAATADCEQYWDFCISDFNVECSSDTNNTTIINGVEYFNYDSGYISTTINGVYNPYTDQYVYDSNIQYSITVTGPGGYNETQNQNSDTTPNSNVFTNTFDGVTAPGLYTVTYTFFGPYVDYFSDPTYIANGACVLTNEVTIPSPIDSGCGDIVLGCTDPGYDNFDPNATVDDGSCENIDPCEDALNNGNFLFTTVTTNSTSTCFTDIITINGEPYESTVPSPDNNGTMAVSISYTPPESGLAINTFAVLLINTVSASPGIQNILDSVAILFSSPPTDEINGVSIDGIGYWSPLNTVGAGTQLFLQQFTGLPPGNYYVLVVANPTVESLADCGEGAFASIQDFFTVVNIGLDAPDGDCPEPCLGPNCEDYTLGCTDPDADNYNPDATFDDGSCEPEVSACEQDPNDPACYDCADELSGVAPRYATGNVEEPPCDSVEGSDGYCTDPNACNYDPDAPLDLSNNLICDYCSCNGEDPDCFEDSDCDPDLDPNCGGPEPECPDPSNPDCNPTIYDPCPGDECGPPIDPCLILGNCAPDDGGDGLDEDNFFDEVNPVEVTCIPDIETTGTSQLNFGAVQQQAFQCMSQEGQKMLFRMKSGAYYDDTDVLKLSLIAYLLGGGLNKTELSCIFNCNYESADKAKAYSCGDVWVAGGTKYYNSTDSYNRGDVILYYYKKGSKVTRAFYTAVRDVTPFDVAPRFPNSGWTRCQDVKLRTADRNGIATGDEEYLQVFWEFLTRFCNECQVVATPVAEDQNNVDPKVLKNYLNPKTTNTNTSNPSGILGEDGEEIIF